MSPAKTTTATMKGEEDVYDVLGIGFGPANLSLAIALRESAEASERGLRVGWLERQPSFGWHTTLLLPGAQLQVSPFKDLATMRDPTSSYTFVNYLHTKGRLAGYINLEANIPSRREWSAYLTWAAQRMDGVVTYSQEVVSIEPVPSAEGSDGVRLLKVTSRNARNGELSTRLARNVTIAPGGLPRIPAQLANVYPAKPWSEAARVIHSSTFLPSLAAIEPTLSAQATARLGRSSPASASSWPLRLAVVGSGQSAAETSLHLRRTFPSAHVSMIFRASAIVPSDDSTFVNAAAFDPERTDTFWKAGLQERADWIREYKRTNYSVVRSDVLNALSTVMYDQTIELDAPWPGADGHAPGRFEMLCNTQVESSRLTGAGDDQQVELIVSSTKPDADSQPRTLKFDAVVIGTGFERAPSMLPFLQPLASHFPALDANADAKRAELGFPLETETLEARRAAAEQGDDAEERLRERVRGITRDYRLVPYASRAFVKASANAPSPSTSSPGSSNSSDTLDVDASSNGTSDAFEPAVYVLGGNEGSHGLSDSLLSIVAWRAGELTESILRRTANATRSAAAVTAAPAVPSLSKTTAAPSNHLAKPLIAKLDQALRI